MYDVVRTHGVSRAGYNVAITTDDGTHCFPLCNTCFSDFHGIGRSTLQRAVRKVRVGEVPVAKAVPARPTAEVKRQVFKQWMINTVKSFGDFMPDSQTTVLPVYSKRELFQWYDSSVLTDKYEQGQFTKELRKHFNFVTFRRHKQFTQCQTCNAFYSQIKKSQVNTLSSIKDIINKLTYI